MQALFFSQPFTKSTSVRDFEHHLNQLQAAVNQSLASNKATPHFILEVIALLVQRYYQITTKKEFLISQQYLLNHFIGFLHTLVAKYHSRHGPLMKQLLVILLFQTILQLKEAFERNEKCSDLRTTLLSFKLELEEQLLKLKQTKIEEIYPKPYSFSSNLLKNDPISLKHFGLCLQSMKLLIQNNPSFKKGNSTASSNFTIQCHKKLIDDLKYLTNIFYRLELSFKVKVQAFATFLLHFHQKNKGESPSASILLINTAVTASEQLGSQKKDLFAEIILLAQMNEVPICLQSYSLFERNTITELFKEIYGTSCKLITRIDVDMELKRKQLSRLSSLIPYLELLDCEDNDITCKTIQLIKNFFTIRKNHQLITIPHHASTIPIEKLLPTHKLQDYPIKGLHLEYTNEFARMMMQIVPFFELENQLVNQVTNLLNNINQASREALIKYFSEELLQFDYQIDMSLTKLYQYLRTLLAIRFLMKNLPNQLPSDILANSLYSIFDILCNRTESVKSLKASYVQEQIMISVTLQIINLCYFSLNKRYEESKDIRSRIKQTKNSILLLEKIFNQLAEESYLIRLVTTHLLLNFSKDNKIELALKPHQAALIHRNKNNLTLMLSLLELTSLTNTDYEELADYYLSHLNCQHLIRYLLPRISIQSGRKCLLTVQKWWIILTKEVIAWLNQKQMSKGQNKQQNFFTNDGQNVTIKNALGVIILEMGDKWNFYLRSQKREVIIDTLQHLVEVNPGMVFFRRFFDTIIKDLYNILRECLGYQEKLEITCKRRTKKEESPKKESPSLPLKVEFYDRLRFKIYRLITNLPRDNFQLWSPETIKNIKELVTLRHDQVKLDYLFNGNMGLKVQYDLGKPLTDLLDTISTE